MRRLLLREAFLGGVVDVAVVVVCDVHFGFLSPVWLILISYSISGEDANPRPKHLQRDRRTGPDARPAADVLRPRNGL